MKTLLTPKLDYVFKKLFTADSEILIDLLNTVLELPEHRWIRSVEIKNPTILPEQLTEKYIILDILAIDNEQRQYDIEMQAQKYDAYSQRMLYYLCKLYASQLDAGEDYHTLTPVIGIHFLDYEQFPMYRDFHFHFELRDIRYPDLQLTEDLLLYLFELPKLEQIMPVEHWGEKMYEWLHFLNHAHEEGEKTMQTQYKNPTIQKAFTVLERLSADDETRYQADFRERALKFEKIGLAAAHEKGRVIGQIQLAQRVLKQPISSTEELTQKSREELQAIFAELETQLHLA